MIQNTAVRVLTRTSRRYHISTILGSLQWLPMNPRIEFKILLLAHRGFKGLTPTYDHTILTVPHSLQTSLFHIILTEDFTLRLQSYLWFLQFLKREWELSVCVWDANTLSTFKNRLKSLLFGKGFSYKWLG